MHPLQEKFQILAPGKDEAGESWVSAANARHTTEMTDKFNYPLPGMDISNQHFTEQHQMPLVASGENDVSKDVNPSAFRDGFTKREMKGCDDQYTGEHLDLFYGDSGGFVERNNYLDRL